MKIDWKSFTKKRRKLTNNFPVGMVLFTGPQGSGKSLCQMRYIDGLKKRWSAKVYSATDYKNADEKIEEHEIAKKILTKREDTPTMFALDEIQILLDPAATDKITKAQMRKAIQQQRKRNTSIIGTCQILLDLETVYRYQIQYLVKCSKFGPIQHEKWLDGQTLQYNQTTRQWEGKVIPGGNRIWKRHNEMFDLYDTYEVVGNNSKFLQGSAPT